MTRLYNFFSQSQAREPFCDAAAATLADSTTVDAAGLPAFARGDWRCWRSRSPISMPPMTRGVPNAPLPRAWRRRIRRRRARWCVQAVPAAAPPPRPRLELDPSVFAETGAAVAH